MSIYFYLSKKIIIYFLNETFSVDHNRHIHLKKKTQKKQMGKTIGTNITNIKKDFKMNVKRTEKNLKLIRCG